MKLTSEMLDEWADSSAVEREVVTSQGVMCLAFDLSKETVRVFRESQRTDKELALFLAGRLLAAFDAGIDAGIYVSKHYAVTSVEKKPQ